jgi:sporulation protein YlmC with PRC-barrel domain
MAKVFAKKIAEKEVITAKGSRIGTLINVIVDIKSGEIMELVIKPDMNLDTSGYKMQDGYILLPFEQVVGIEDCIVIEQK